DRELDRGRALGREGAARNDDDAARADLEPASVELRSGAHLQAVGQAVAGIDDDVAQPAAGADPGVLRHDAALEHRAGTDLDARTQDGCGEPGAQAYPGIFTDAAPQRRPVASRAQAKGPP